LIACIRSTGAGHFITAAGHTNSVRRSVYHGADCFIPVCSVDVRHRYLWPFDPHPLKCPADHPSFKEARNLQSRVQWDGMRTGYAYDLFVRSP
jgi:hypothetical protein